VGLYSESKLAQLASTFSLERRLGHATVQLHCINPGGVGSDIYRDWSAPARALLRGVFITPADAAVPIATACLDEAYGSSPPLYLQCYRGSFEYWGPLGAVHAGAVLPREPSVVATNRVVQLQLEELTLALLTAAGRSVDLEAIGRALGRP
jgi:hypothetical protein